MVRVTNRLTVRDHLALREVLRHAAIEADAQYAALYFAQELVEFHGDAEFAPRNEPLVRRSVPHVGTATTRASGERDLAIAQVRLSRYLPKGAVVLVSADAAEPIVLDAVDCAVRGVEQLLAEVADRTTKQGRATRSGPA